MAIERDDRVVLTEEVGKMILPRAQVMTFMPIENAITAASSVCPEIPWRRILPALEMAGLVKFGAG